MKEFQESEKSSSEALESLQLAMEAIQEGESMIRQTFAIRHVEAFERTKPFTQWKFNPPSAPDFAGKAEAAVKQVKIKLTKVIGREVLPYAGLMTVLKLVESALNSQPLCRIVGKLGERERILTPSLLALGRTLLALPEPDYTVLNMKTQYQRRVCFNISGRSGAQSISIN